MTLPVPLAVRIGDERVTRQVQSLSFRREAVGGVRSISFSLARSLTGLDGIDPLAKVYVYDGRSASTVAEGRLADTGRGAGPDGQRWDCVAFGPAQHASDIERPLIYVDKSTEGWWFAFNDNVEAGAKWEAGSTPDDATPCLLSTWSDGTVLPGGNSITAMRYTRVLEAGQKLARFSYGHRAATTGLVVQAIYTTDESYAAKDDGTSQAWSTAGSSRTEIVGTDWTNGRNTIDIRTLQNFVAGAISGDAFWCAVVPVVEAIRYAANGAEVSTSDYVGFTYSHGIVNDLLGRMLPEFDGAGASVDTGGTLFQITQLAYPDGTTAEQVLADLMAMEPGYRWTTTPDRTGNGYGFSWEPWPTSVRYEATLDDGGSFPLSAQALYNEVTVRWTDQLRRTRTTRRTMACPLLDDNGLIRRKMIDLGGELGTEAQAVQAGDAFLADHNVPKNSGTLTVARPIRDVITGRMVDPWEVEAGELVRIRGVEAYPDSFNADTNDGQGVFRIHAVDYTTEGNVATLALDSDPRETEDALVKLMNKRERR